MVNCEWAMVNCEWAMGKEDLLIYHSQFTIHNSPFTSDSYVKQNNTLLPQQPSAHCSSFGGIDCVWLVCSLEDGSGRIS